MEKLKEKYIMKDWKRAVRQVIQELVDNSESKVIILNRNKKFVLRKHPELKIIDSRKSKLFMKILARKRYLLTLPDGPLIVMKEMEKRIRLKKW